MSRLSWWQTSLESSTVTGTGTVAKPVAKRAPALRILAHPDVRRIGARVCLPALASGRDAVISRLTPLFGSPSEEGEPEPLADPRLSRQPLRLTRSSSGAVRLIRDAFRGDCEVNGAALEQECLVSESMLERGAVILIAHRVALLLHEEPFDMSQETRRFGLVGDSEAMVRLRTEIRRLGRLEVPVLLRGETGTGKELVARAIHDAGPRCGRAYVPVNMAAIPSSLAAAELFGTSRGAFTGADRPRLGYFRRAAGGTLFLDEIGAAPIEIQDLLLRVLENHAIQPVGADQPQEVDVRVVAATDADLDDATVGGEFRAPLLYRLSGWEIRLPPLRERRADVAPLLLHFLSEQLAALGAAERLRDPGPHGRPWLPAPLVARLVAFDWPGNVRQLRNLARQLASGCHELDQAVLGPESERQLVAPEPAPKEAGREPAPEPRRRKRSYRKPTEITDAELLDALRANRWRLQPTAETLGVARTSLYSLIERCDAIRKGSDLSQAEIEAALARMQDDVDATAEALEVSRHSLLMRMTELGLRD